MNSHVRLSVGRSVGRSVIISSFTSHAPIGSLVVVILSDAPSSAQLKTDLGGSTKQFEKVSISLKKPTKRTLPFLQIKRDLLHTTIFYEFMHWEQFLHIQYLILVVMDKFPVLQYLLKCKGISISDLSHHSLPHIRTHSHPWSPSPVTTAAWHRIAKSFGLCTNMPSTNSYFGGIHPLFDS